MSKNLPLSQPSPIIQTIYHKIKKPILTFPENSRHTKQSFAQECDINTIMARYQSTGEMPVLNQQAPQYLDVTGADFQASMEFLRGASDLFNQLPSDLRDRFQNDPAQFLDFTSNPKNRDEMKALGLLKPEALSSSDRPAVGGMGGSAPHDKPAEGGSAA